MKVELVQPASGQDGDSPNLNIAQASFAYPKPASKQLRTLALVRTGARSGFYVDIFRSDNTEPAEGYHDYLYHGLGQSLSLTDAAGKALALSPSTLLTSAQGNLKGYDYFKNEKSIEHAGDFRGVLALDPGENKPKRAMSLWMLGNKERTIFSVEAPSCRATRDSLPKFMEVPMPALVVRQKGNAWEQPFITVFEPYFEGDGATIESVRPAKIEGNAAGLAAVVIEGRATGEGAPRFRAMVMEDQRPDQPRKVEGYDFQGKAGVILVRGDTVERLFETTVQPSTASAAAKK